MCFKYLGIGLNLIRHMIEGGAVDNAQLGEKQVEASKAGGGVSVSRDLVAAGQGGSTLEVVFIRQGSTKTRVLIHSIAS